MTLSAIFLPNVLRCKPTSVCVSICFFFVYALNLLVQCSFLCLLLSSKKVLCDIQSRLTGNQYWLASCITALQHPTYQRCSLQRPFRTLLLIKRDCQGEFISRPASRLDAFSVYQFRMQLPGNAIGMTTRTPGIRPLRSSRTRSGFPQYSMPAADRRPNCLTTF